MSIELVNKPLAAELEPIRAAIIGKVEAAEGEFNSRRIFHGRGRCFPGLESIAIDVFYPVLALTLFQELERELEESLFLLLKSTLAASPSLQTVIVQRRYQADTHFFVLTGELPSSLYAQRNGLKFNLNLEQQNIGYFLDIEPARVWLEERAKQSQILNLFSYTCTFSVVAMASGADSVLNMDLSSRSLATGRDNHRENALPLDKVKFFANNIFKSWGRIKRFSPYDIAIIDPPSFQKGSFVANKDYEKVLRRMPGYLNKDGYILACLNSPEVSADEFQALLEQHLEGCRFVERLAGHEDFQDADAQRALKMFVYQKV